MFKAGSAGIAIPLTTRDLGKAVGRGSMVYVAATDLLWESINEVYRGGPRQEAYLYLSSFTK